MYQHFVHTARVEQHQQQLRHEASIERSVRAAQEENEQQAAVQKTARPSLARALGALKAGLRLRPA